MIEFFTFCDKHYAAQAAVMIDSLLRHVSEEIVVTLHHLDSPTSDQMNWWISRKRLPPICLDPIWLVESQEPRLEEAQKNRSYKAWCWSLEPAIVHRQLLDHVDGTILCYCDADVMWCADTVPDILAAMERADVALSPHRFPKGHEHRERSVGKFNFGVAVMRVCDLTRKVVGEWLDQTLEKCDEYAGGDQIHLDSWIDKLGMRLAELPATWNAAPWQNVEITGDPPMLGDKRLVSWHFHEHRRGIGKNPVIINGEPWCRSGYDLPESTVQSVYLPYQTELEKFLP